jgi:hypothetical protein
MTYKRTGSPTSSEVRGQERRIVAVREFTDSHGITWRVWKTRPSIAMLYTEEQRNGWLTFESATERRRLAPVPGGWEEISVDRLELFCRVAESS